MSYSAEQKLQVILAPPKGKVAKKWSLFVMLGEPGYPRRHVEALFSGAVGAGKSRAVAAWLIMRAFQYPGIRLALVRDTLKNLQRSTLQTLFEASEGLIARDYKGYDPNTHIAYYNKRDEKVIFKNGSEIHLFGTNDAQSANRLVGTEWGGVAVDQLERIPKKIYVQIIPRLRQNVRHRETGEIIFPMIKSTANVDKGKSSWVVRRFLEGSIPLGRGELSDSVRQVKAVYRIDGEDVVTWRAYFRVGLGENESVNPHYKAVLAAAGQDIAGFLADDWQPDFEQIFSYEWDDQIFTDDITDFRDFDLYIGHDFGVASPQATIFGLWHRDRRILYIYGEYIESGRDAKEYATTISAIINDYVLGGIRSIRFSADPTLWRRTGAGGSLADIYLRVFRDHVPANIPLVMEKAFRQGTMKLTDPQATFATKYLLRTRRMFVHKYRAPQTLETLATVTWKEAFGDKHPETDIFDAVRYLTMRLPDPEITGALVKTEVEDEDENPMAKKTGRRVATWRLE